MTRATPSQREERFMNKVTSADGTPIAFERFGDGQPVIVVGGATCDRATTPARRGTASGTEPGRSDTRAA
jgi:hypothetical protein